MIFFSKKVFILFSTLLFLFSCSGNSTYYEKEFYEQISGIKIPENAIIVESIDNGEFLTATTFKMDSGDFNYFIKNYTFTKAEGDVILGFFADSYLVKDKPDLKKRSSLYYLSGRKGKNSWIYLADIDKKLLWAEIRYPDAAGH